MTDMWLPAPPDPLPQGEGEHYNCIYSREGAWRAHG